MRLEFHPHTLSDLNNAVEYYNQQRAGLGDALRVEVQSAIERRLYPTAGKGSGMSKRVTLAQ